MIKSPCKNCPYKTENYSCRKNCKLLDKVQTYDLMGFNHSIASTNEIDEFKVNYLNSRSQQTSKRVLFGGFR